jgi:peptide chain release factor 1
MLARLPMDPRYHNTVFVVVRAGSGGAVAGLFAADLFRMYSRYADRKNWKVEVMSRSESGVGGFKEIIFEVQGKGAYQAKKLILDDKVRGVLPLLSLESERKEVKP